MVPHDIIIEDLLTILLSEVENVVLAVVDHLLSDFNEQASHSIVSVVVTRNSMDHLDTVHQCGQCVLDGVRSAFVERLDKLLKSGQVLHIVLGLIECFSNSKLDASPFRCGKEDLVARLSKLIS
jgi:hypothetical protein